MNKQFNLAKPAYVAPKMEMFQIKLTQGLLQEAIGSGTLVDEIELVGEDQW